MEVFINHLIFSCKSNAMAAFMLKPKRAFVMPECFYRASSVFSAGDKKIKTLDSRLRRAGMTV